MLRFLSDRPLRLPHFRPHVPAPDDPAIFWFNSERDDIVADVVERIAQHYGRDPRALEIALNDTAFHEIRRLSQQRDNEAEAWIGYWRHLVRRIARLSDDEKRHTLRDITARFAKDVAGNFDPRVFELTRKIIPGLLSGLMRPAELPSLLRQGWGATDQMLSIEGEIDHIRKLQDIGTLVYVPTHSSNLDSVVLGAAIDRAGLAPVVYGAGKNLFTNPIISFFMHNLGAYRIDRRIQADVYKVVLKTYSQVMIERGYHSLFFPGGTRSRAGMIESRLKLGLAGSALEAFSNNQARGVPKRVFFVPTTINYALVLEAETLIEDWLKERGKARYIIEDDEFSRVDRWVSFFRKLMGMDAVCVMRFGKPIDPFGNPVDDEGLSIVPGGRTIDPATYVLRGGKPSVDVARDAAYTRELAEVLVERFRHESVIMATQLVAHVLFRHLVSETPKLDLFARLRLRSEISMPVEAIHTEIGEARDRLRDLDLVRLSQFLRSATPDALLARVLEIFHGYHQHIAIHREGSRVVLDEPTLLLYYQNRLIPFAERIAPPGRIEAAREIANIEGPK